MVRKTFGVVAEVGARVTIGAPGDVSANDPETGPRGQQPAPALVTVPEYVPMMAGLRAEIVSVAVPVAVPAHGGEKTRESVADEPLIVPVIVPLGVVAVKMQPDWATVTGCPLYRRPHELLPVARYEPATLVQEAGSEGELDPPPQPASAARRASESNREPRA
jgi:hypothetical protein